MASPFDIEIADDAWKDLAWFGKRDQVLILDAIEVQLRHQPDVETRNANASAKGTSRSGNFASATSVCFTIWSRMHAW